MSMFITAGRTGSFPRMDLELTALSFSVIINSNSYIVTNRHVINNTN